MFENILGIDKIWYLVLAAFAVEAATNLITKSEFASRTYKKWLFKHRENKFCNFLHDLLDCGYCTSVWVSIFAAVWYNEGWGIELILFILIIHRLSNVAHFLIDWLDEKRSRDLYYTREGEDYEGLREEHDAPLGSHDEESSGAGAKDSPR
jgi:hypothetical protein